MTQDWPIFGVFELVRDVLAGRGGEVGCELFLFTFD
jgi:hypothetical protein